jgi:hypothetical protein
MKRNTFNFTLPPLTLMVLVQWLLCFVFVLCHSFCNTQSINLVDVLQTNSDEFDYFGYSVSISGDTIVVGAIQESSNATGVNGDSNNNNAPIQEQHTYL